ncbi:hypothetical protein BDQ94DRAFT_151756 [Aspergillus welwitschiae]|uniref:Uncharacterized protein n=1 Tax=Aspergillus welwitschiae TaxID=1341132 RepID=A0A3F3PPB7_9EURO|nr:hypothetical protein BDQ94DRAFT_151756 [Aspergillus welwitschiae]RDH28693.1 hypothetical protein BDQ94DRAFT_151756 [Aspergillus welwitschiae]
MYLPSLRLVSDAQQKIIIKHADIQIFLNHYLPQSISSDVQVLRSLNLDSISF